MTRDKLRHVFCLTCAESPAECPHEKKPELDQFGRCKYYTSFFTKGGKHNELRNNVWPDNKKAGTESDKQ